MAFIDFERAGTARWLSSAVLAAAVVALTACGGGGDSAPDVKVPTGARVMAASSGADLTADNFDQISAPVVRAVLGSASDSLLDITAGAGREHAQAAVRALRDGAASPRLLSGLAALGMRSADVRERAAASGSETVSCPGGGTMTVTVNDADNNNKLSAPDSLSLSTFNCVAELGLPAANGGFSMTINAVELNSLEEPTAIDVSASFNAFQVIGFGSMSGGFRLWARSTDANNGVARVSYIDTIVAELGQSVTYNFDVYTATAYAVPTYEISGGIGIGGQTYAIELSGAFVGVTPAIGSLKIKDAAGDSVKLTAVSSTTFDLDFFAAADPITPVAVLHGLYWADYTQP